MERMIHLTQQFHIFRCVIQLLLAEITAPVGTLLFLIDIHTEDAFSDMRQAMFDLRHPVRQQPRCQHRIARLTLRMPAINREPTEVKRRIMRQPKPLRPLEEPVDFTETIFVGVE